MLEKWIYFGILEDPYLEFFISSNINFNNKNNHNNTHNNKNNNKNNDEWEEKFQLEIEKIPIFLSSDSLPEKILSTGKYIFILRNWMGLEGDDWKALEHSSFSFHSNIRILHEQINDAYKYASKKVLELLIHREKLLLKLRFVLLFLILYFLFYYYFLFF